MLQQLVYTYEYSYYQPVNSSIGSAAWFLIHLHPLIRWCVRHSVQKLCNSSNQCVLFHYQMPCSVAYRNRRSDAMSRLGSLLNDTIWDFGECIIFKVVFYLVWSHVTLIADLFKTCCCPYMVGNSALIVWCPLTDLWGSTMTEAVSRRLVTAEARVRSRVDPCTICGGQSSIRTRFSPSTSGFPCQFHCTGAQLKLNTEKKLWSFASSSS
jgi:hypothetical protein